MNDVALFDNASHQEFDSYIEQTNRSSHSNRAGGGNFSRGKVREDRENRLEGWKICQRSQCVGARQMIGVTSTCAGTGRRSRSIKVQDSNRGRTFYNYWLGSELAVCTTGESFHVCLFLFLFFSASLKVNLHERNLSLRERKKANYCRTDAKWSIRVFETCTRSKKSLEIFEN